MACPRFDTRAARRLCGFQKALQLLSDAGFPHRPDEGGTEKYRTSKGTLQFSQDKPLPTALLKKMVKLASLRTRCERQPSKPRLKVI